MSRVRIRVRAFARDGFFRAHRYWPGEPVEDEVDEATLTILQNERHLAVEILGRSADVEEDEERSRRPAPPPPLPKPGNGKPPNKPAGPSDGGGGA